LCDQPGKVARQCLPFGLGNRSRLCSFGLRRQRVKRIDDRVEILVFESLDDCRDGITAEPDAISGSAPSVTWAGATDDALSAANTVMADRIDIDMKYGLLAVRHPTKRLDFLRVLHCALGQLPVCVAPLSAELPEGCPPLCC
jgi:hypothetical protein